MTFVNVKDLKNAVSASAKIADKNNTNVAIHLSKEGELSLNVLLGIDGMITIPVPSHTVKTRSQSSAKALSVNLKTIGRLVTSLPVTMEEVEIEFDRDRIRLSGEYDLDSRLEYEVPTFVGVYQDYDCTEQKMAEFKTGAEIATVLTAASALARNGERLRVGYVHIVGTDDELLVEATDGIQIYQKYIYTQECFAPAIDIAVAPSMGAAIGKFAFTVAFWEVYQNFVKLTLDDKIQIYSTRSLMEFPKNLSRFFEGTSNHVTVVVNPNELKARLAKIDSKTNLWLYTSDNQLVIEYLDRGIHGKTAVKNTLKTAPAYAGLNCGRLSQVLKLVKKTTGSLVLKLPKLPETEALTKLEHNGENPTPVVLLEFDRNSHILAALKSDLSKPLPGVKDWFASQGWAIFLESQPASNKARSVADILSDRWTGKGWERPELLKCECGSIHQSKELAEQYPQVLDDCTYCERDQPLILQRIDYRCRCGVRNTSTYSEPILDPICMGCGKKDEFTVLHYFQCDNCNKSKIFETLQFEAVTNRKVCFYGASVEEPEQSLALMGACRDCGTTFDGIDPTEFFMDVELENFKEFVDPVALRFIACPSCKSKECELTIQERYWCNDCDKYVPIVYHLPAVLPEPTLPCPDCDKDLHDITTQAPTDIFLVGSVARF